MEKILIDWLKNYTNSEIKSNTEFGNLNFDIFDEAMTVDFVNKQFQIDINISDTWFVTVKDLLDAIASRT
jgi:acyl carrier protein